MKREILFKGKRISDPTEWAEGYFYTIQNKEYYILEPCILGLLHTEIIPDTLCQFTGKTIQLKHPMFDDKIKLFENDVFTLGNSKTKYKVVFENFEWIGVSNEGDDWGSYKCKLSQIRENIHIIGNINDNPKLMSET